LLRGAHPAGETDAYSDLANGRVDAVQLDYPIALYYAMPSQALRPVIVPQAFRIVIPTTSSRC